MNVAVGAKSDVGQVREANEDSYLVDEPLFVVADGMGGHIAGDVASSTAVSVISGNAATATAENLETLAELVRSANKAIWEKAGEDPNLRGMGTTCTLMLVDNSRAHFAHVGDSRAYLMRGGELSQITEDHTLVERMVKEGRLKPEEAESHPQRSIITRALGVDSDVEVDLMSLDLQPGDRIVLNSDGLSSMISDEAIAGPLREETDPQVASERLVELANQAGGEDNVTVVIVDVTDQKRPAAATAVRRSPVSAERPAPPAQAVAKRTWPKKLALTLLIVALLAAGGFFAGNAYLNSQWYIALNDDNVVTIFNGVDGEVLGYSLSSVSEVSDPPIAAADLPESERESVKDGLTVDSEEEAQDKLKSLRDQAREQRDLAKPKPDESPSPSEGGNKAADKRREEKSGGANN
jgi:protein phosphatase